MRKTLVVGLAVAVLSAPAYAQSSLPSPAQDLSSCAGAVAAVGGLDVLHYPRGASGEWSGVLGGILARLNEVEGLEGMTGRYAASAAKSFWQERPRAEREAEASACRTRYAG